EIYRVVNAIEEVADSLVVGQSINGDERVILFVLLNEGLILNKELISTIKKSIRSNCTQRHVPAIILQTKDIPYTINGKKVEIAVKKIIHGEEVTNQDALANPGSLDLYRNINELL
ncbi:acetoacetate--CoA ligase, partial [Candidatus Marinimicrobia bacterium]|nr:acetoacetate--CoA ligase [Candidatus Neomarinimicrobiota bacterium]